MEETSIILNIVPGKTFKLILNGQHCNETCLNNDDILFKNLCTRVFNNVKKHKFQFST